jgi:AcrR family transcriptional regulator
MAEETSRRQLVRKERRKQILEAALAVFSRKGYNAANVSDVAAEAGVSQGTIMRPMCPTSRLRRG